MLLRLVPLAIILSFATACTHWQKSQLTGRNHPSGWANEIRNAAAEAYPYAQMSNNAYADTGRYLLDPSIILIRDVDNDDAGFAYSVFERNGPESKEVIVAYRGTEWHNLKDMMKGNVLLRQNAKGLAVYDEVRAATNAEVPVTVTGHSLGGAIAIHVSLQRPGAKAYIFNASPRFRASGGIPDNRRLSIVEYGEVLKLFRIAGREATQEYISINCTPGRDPIRQHSMRLLGDCLTRMAAWASPQARSSLTINGIAWPAGLTS